MLNLSGELILHFGIRIPFIDSETPLGYTLNFINFLISIFLFQASTILVCIDISICVLCSYGQYNVLEIYLKELSTLVLDNEGRETSNEIKQKIAEIVELHNYLNE